MCIRDSHKVIAYYNRRTVDELAKRRKNTTQPSVEICACLFIFSYVFTNIQQNLQDGYTASIWTQFLLCFNQFYKFILCVWEIDYAVQRFSLFNFLSGQSLTCNFFLSEDWCTTPASHDNLLVFPSFFFVKVAKPRLLSICFHKIMPVPISWFLHVQQYSVAYLLTSYLLQCSEITTASLDSLSLLSASILCSSSPLNICIYLFPSFCTIYRFNNTVVSYSVRFNFNDALLLKIMDAIV